MTLKLNYLINRALDATLNTALQILFSFSEIQTKGESNECKQNAIK